MWGLGVLQDSEPQDSIGFDVRDEGSSEVLAWSSLWGQGKELRCDNRKWVHGTQWEESSVWGSGALWYGLTSSCPSLLFSVGCVPSPEVLFLVIYTPIVGLRSWLTPSLSISRLRGLKSWYFLECLSHWFNLYSAVACPAGTGSETNCLCWLILTSKCQVLSRTHDNCRWSLGLTRAGLISFLIVDDGSFHCHAHKIGCHDGLSVIISQHHVSKSALTGGIYLEFMG